MQFKGLFSGAIICYVSFRDGISAFPLRMKQGDMALIAIAPQVYWASWQLCSWGNSVHRSQAEIGLLKFMLGLDHPKKRRKNMGETQLEKSFSTKFLFDRLDHVFIYVFIYGIPFGDHLIKLERYGAD